MVAVAIPRTDGSLPRDRRGRVKVTDVRITANGDLDRALPGGPDVPVSERDLTWMVEKRRRYWASIERRFAVTALEMAMNLVGAGIVDLFCEVDDALHIGAVKHWQLTEPWDQHRRMRMQTEIARDETWRARADAAAERVRDIDPGLSAALSRTRASSGRFPVLVYAAEDLAEGVSHDGPRAFSQAHFTTTKDRDDVTKILTDYGADPATVIALGLERSPYLGLGGPITIQAGTGQINLCGLDGPLQFRATNRKKIDFAVIQGTPDLAIIENLQAAEATCDNFPEVAVVWCAGQPSDAALDVIVSLAASVENVYVIPDADLGGVRIAKRIVSALEAGAEARVVDVGTRPHPKREPFGKASSEGLSLLAQGSGSVARFARACLGRGYPVEQEATIRSAVTEALITDEPR